MVNQTEGQVEVFDNGVHLGWADLDDGRWAYPVSGLPAGSHSLTAKYENKESAAWQIIIRDQIVSDNFDNAPLALITTLPRPNFVVRVLESDPSGGDLGTSFCRVAIINAHQAFGNGRMLTTEVRPYSAPPYPYLRIVVDVEFVKPYSMVAFSAFPFRFPGGLRNTNKVEAFDKDSRVVQQEDFKRWYYVPVAVTLGVRGARNITRLRFTLAAEQLPIQVNGETLSVDDFTLTE